ncbi:hypothetical protein MMMDOFMJ_3149 [Methylobacterium gnaphalii]|nr:hypothetical protein MMMDOFMJ_3149 [Methylobacterium gnaphalii]
MLFFLASVLEQLDLALEHVSKRDIHNARFGLMLTDNALELIFHQIAKNKASELKAYSYRQENYRHQKALDKALGRNFDEKVKLAKLENHLADPVAQTIKIMHGFRNELYHVGIQHEAILPNLALFYFEVACNFLRTFRISGFYWSSSMVIPERAKKYLNATRFSPAAPEDFENAFTFLACNSGHDADETIAAFADHIESIIEEQDTYIDIIARGVYVGQEKTRDEAIIDCQSWSIAFSDEGKAFLTNNDWSGSVLSAVQFITKNYELKYRSDPIPSWERQVARLRAQKDPHAALMHYHSFVTETADLREWVSESAGQAEAEIDAAIDRMRGK